MKGFISLASDLITCDSKFSNIISNLLGRIVIFDTIERAAEMAKACRYRVKAVTLDGQVINAGGSFTGGSTRTEGTILGRAAEVRKLEEELLKRQKKAKEIENDLEDLRKEIADTQKTLNAASDKCKVVEMLRNAELRRAVAEVNGIVQSYKRIETFVVRAEEFPKNASRKIKRAGLADSVFEEYQKKVKG